MQTYWTNKSNVRKWGSCILLLVVLGFGAFLRLWNLGEPSFWVDEVEFHSAAKSWLETGELTMESGYVYDRAPLYSYITAVFFKFLHADETSTRLCAALFGLLSIVMVFILARKIFNTRIGLLAAFMTAFSHFEIGWSRTARVYTLFQFFTLVVIYAFIRGFEFKMGKKIPVSKSPDNSLLCRVKLFWQRCGVHPCWLVIATIASAVTYQFLHILILFLLLSILIYIFFMAKITFFISENSRRFLNRYTVTSLLALLGVGFILVAFPSVRQLIRYFLSYTPSWAEGPVTAQNRMLLFEFLISPYRFPLAALFFIGAVQVFFRTHRQGILLFFLFLCPLFLLSFVFTHRVSVYLFNVYPMFLILAAYGFINIVDSESLKSLDIFKRLRRQGWNKFPWIEKCLPLVLLVALLLVFLISPWLRISLNIPFHGDGFTNMAVTHCEWREGVKKLKSKLEEGDVVLASLPQTSSYYGVKADYTLNWALLKLSHEKQYKNEDGRWVDYYAGVVCIESLAELEEIVSSHSRGWVIVERYQFDAKEYIPDEVKNYILEQLGDPIRTKRETILIFQWGEGRE